MPYPDKVSHPDLNWFRIHDNLIFLKDLERSCVIPHLAKVSQPELNWSRIRDRKEFLPRVVQFPENLGWLKLNSIFLGL